MRKALGILLILSQITLMAQECDWQQFVDYKMKIDVDEQNFRYTGNMDLTYFNHSPDTLDKIYFHLYYNAFQPGSAMDYRLQNISDPDSRMMETAEDGKKLSRISQLGESDIGYQKINSITQNGKELSYKISGTVMEVILDKAAEPGQSVLLQLNWVAQIPPVIRRGGKNSREGVDFTMTQWYPKPAQYDQFGWHLDEYIGREFYSPFGDFDVSISIQKDYVIGASGKLQNPNEVKGYVKNARPKVKDGKVNWNFKADRILDFAWAADKEFVVSSAQVENGPLVYFVKKNEADLLKTWKEAEKPTLQFFEFLSDYFGEYPWETYSVVQGGDGGMEYGTSTMVTGKRNLDSLIGVIYHEVAHSWFQQLFAFNETIDEWMDEGFTSYAHQLAYLNIFDKPVPPNPNENAYDSYFRLVKSGKEEPMSLLADYYDYNFAYGVEAYNKGQVYLIQLGYIIGEENLKKTFSKFYENFKFTHPTPNDFKRTAEEVSGLNLKWYQVLFVNTTRSIDYSIFRVTEQNIELRNLSNLAMPIDLFVEYEDGSKELFYIPNLELRGEKPAEDLEIYKGVKRTVLEPWAWTNPDYSVKISKKVKRAEIDPTRRLADVNHSNNIYTR